MVRDRSDRFTGPTPPAGQPVTASAASGGRVCDQSAGIIVVVARPARPTSGASTRPALALRRIGLSRTNAAASHDQQYESRSCPGSPLLGRARSSLLGSGVGARASPFNAPAGHLAHLQWSEFARRHLAGLRSGGLDAGGIVPRGIGLLLWSGRSLLCWA